jgi:hypothetical protein
MKLFVGLALALASFFACTPAARAPIEADLERALTAENLACLVAQHLPNASSDVHASIVLSCDIGPAVTQVALSFLELEDRLHEADGGP